ncbi:MAG: hypothetical protein SPF91_13230 [Clostridium sp.]|nr:hypothetical protein [Clostridium sp.]
MSKWLSKLKVKAILPAAALIAAAAIGTTFAWKQWDLSVTNRLQAHTTEVDVQEEFDGNKKENVAFKNDGSSSVFLRVAYSEYWEKGEGNDRKILPNTMKDDSGAEISAAEKVWSENWKNSEKWIHCSDGWSYYKTSLSPGESTPVILISAQPRTSDLPEEYQGANYHLYFKAEVVQCSDESNTLNSDEVNRAAINEVFGKSLGEEALTFNIVDEKKIYTVAWPGDMSWEAFEGR